jgi:hypothetical protein
MLRGGGSSTATKAHVLFTFNFVIEFFEELRTNYQGVKIDKLHTLLEFQRRPHENLQEVYMWIPMLINVTKGVTKGPSYLILVWDLGKGSKVTGAKHSS